MNIIYHTYGLLNKRQQYVNYCRLWSIIAYLTLTSPLENLTL